MSGRPRLLDLFSGAGGAARGYQMAGFHVTGVDIKPQPRYAGDVFVQGDAMEYVAEHGHEFDAIHASPPCQAFTQMSARWRGKSTQADGHPDLLTPTRELLAAFRQPWVIENVQGARAAMGDCVVLHGGMFGLRVHRARLFESNVLLFRIKARRTVGGIGVYGERPDGRRLHTTSPVRAASSIQEASEAMGIDWMEWSEIKEAIPPAYTAWIGAQLLNVLRAERAS